MLIYISSTIYYAVVSADLACMIVYVISQSLLFCSYLRHMRPAAESETAGGYEAYIGCLKALQSAVDGLFYSSVDNYSPVPSNPVSSSVDSSNEAMDISP